MHTMGRSTAATILSCSPLTWLGAQRLRVQRTWSIIIVCLGNIFTSIVVNYARRNVPTVEH
jgi:hypothetical protein